LERDCGTVSLSQRQDIIDRQYKLQLTTSLSTLTDQGIKAHRERSMRALEILLLTYLSK